MYFLKQFIYKIIQLCQWLPIIWKDEDWDYDYLLILIQYKLKRIKACLWNNRIIEHKELRDTIIDINKCISAIDEYRSASEIYNEYYEQPSISIGHSKELSNSLKGCYHYKPISLETGKELTEKENSIYCQYIRNVHAFEQKKWEEIWDRIKEHGQKFWD